MNKDIKDIYISRTNLPSLKQYNNYLKRIWQSNWLTNNGQLVQELEKKLKKRFGVKHVICVANGTSALMIALKALNIKQEISVSPFNFIATAAAPVWLGIKPKFIDLQEQFKGPAILTHVYGIPNIVDVKPVIYDASHAFFTTYKGKPIVQWGDVSIMSFSATKIFQSAEGGAIFTNNDQVAEKAAWMRNYGMKTRDTFYKEGMNAKMSEFHAAMGLCSLDLVDRMHIKYNQICNKYNKALEYNYQDIIYYPIWYKSEQQLLRAISKFEKNNIFPRRYFYPALNQVFGNQKCPRAENSMRKVLALPLYYELTNKDTDLIIKIAKETLC